MSCDRYPEINGIVPSLRQPTAETPPVTFGETFHRKSSGCAAATGGSFK